MSTASEVRLPWSAVPQAWGHPWHSMCSYLGAFPAALARTFITCFSERGDIVLDPFVGRGTSLLEARLLGRVAIATDLNPIAVALALAKNTQEPQGAIDARITSLQASYDAVLYAAEAEVQPDDIQLIFHPSTLAQLCFLRRRLARDSDPTSAFITGALLGIMHGGERQDGTSSYASISMPNTFSMSPDYVRRFVANNRLQRRHRDVFQLLRDKCGRLYREGPAAGPIGIVSRADASRLGSEQDLAPIRGKVGLVITSPPYLDVVNYAKQNWIRSWLLTATPDVVSEELHDNLTLAAWQGFMQATLDQLKTLLAPGGVMVFVIGDVAKPGRASVSLARQFIRQVIHAGEFGYVGCLSDRLQTELKTTRIWKETKGKATAVDRVVIVSTDQPRIRDCPVSETLAGIADPFPASPQAMREYACRFAGV